MGTPILYPSTTIYNAKGSGDAIKLSKNDLKVSLRLGRKHFSDKLVDKDMFEIAQSRGWQHTASPQARSGGLCLSMPSPMLGSKELCL